MPKFGMAAPLKPAYDGQEACIEFRKRTNPIR
jgi:hypothetical protein